MSEPKRTPRAWTVDQFKLLLTAAVDAPSLPRFAPTWFADHWTALLLTMRDTGVRLSALLECDRTSLEGNHLRVDASLQKHGADTLHELRPETLAVLQRLPAHKLLFPWPMRKRQIWVRYERDILGPSGLLKRDQGASDYRGLKFHRIRRTSASYVAAAAGEFAAMQHLGHANIETTRNSYLDPKIAHPRTSAARILPSLDEKAEGPEGGASA